MAAPAELNPCPEIEIVKKITASNSLHPAYEAHIKNVAGTIEADKNKQLFEKQTPLKLNTLITLT